MSYFKQLISNESITAEDTGDVKVEDKVKPGSTEVLDEEKKPSTLFDKLVNGEKLEKPTEDTKATGEVNEVKDANISGTKQQDLEVNEEIKRIEKEAVASALERVNDVIKNSSSLEANSEIVSVYLNILKNNYGISIESNDIDSTISTLRADIDKLNPRNRMTAYHYMKHVGEVTRSFNVALEQIETINLDELQQEVSNEGVIGSIGKGIKWVFNKIIEFFKWILGLGKKLLQFIGIMKDDVKKEAKRNKDSAEVAKKAVRAVVDYKIVKTPKEVTVRVKKNINPVLVNTPVVQKTISELETEKAIADLDASTKKMQDAVARAAEEMKSLGKPIGPKQVATSPIVLEGPDAQIIAVTGVNPAEVEKRFKLINQLGGRVKYLMTNVVNDATVIKCIDQVEKIIETAVGNTKANSKEEAEKIDNNIDEIINKDFETLYKIYHNAPEIKDVPFVITENAQIVKNNNENMAGSRSYPTYDYSTMGVNMPKEIKVDFARIITYPVDVEFAIDKSELSYKDLMKVVEKQHMALDKIVKRIAVFDGKLIGYIEELKQADTPYSRYLIRRLYNSGIVKFSELFKYVLQEYKNYSKAQAEFIRLLSKQVAILKFDRIKAKAK